MRHKEKRRCSPTDFYSVGAERGRPRTEVRRARSLCLAREGTVCTKVVLQSRVRIGLWWLKQLHFLAAWGYWSSTSSRSSSRCTSACGRFLPLAGVSPCSSCWSLLSLFRVEFVFSWLFRWFRGLRIFCRLCGIS